MVQIQIDLSAEEDKIVSIYKAEKELETKEQAIKQIIRESQKCSHEFEVLKHEHRLLTTIIQRCKKCGIIRQDKVHQDGQIETSFSKK